MGFSRCFRIPLVLLLLYCRSSSVAGLTAGNTFSRPISDHAVKVRCSSLLSLRFLSRVAVSCGALEPNLCGSVRAWDAKHDAEQRSQGTTYAFLTEKTRQPSFWWLYIGTVLIALGIPLMYVGILLLERFGRHGMGVLLSGLCIQLVGGWMIFHEWCIATSV